MGQRYEEYGVSKLLVLPVHSLLSSLHVGAMGTKPIPYPFATESISRKATTMFAGAHN